MSKRRDCKHYEPIDETREKCFGAGIEGNRDPKNSPKCKGKYFEAGEW